MKYVRPATEYVIQFGHETVFSGRHERLRRNSVPPIARTP